MQMKKVWPLLALVAALIAGCIGSGGPYHETFEEPGDWRTGSDGDAVGQVEDGVFEMLVRGDNLFIWTTAGKSFGDASYQVEATQVEGPLNNGYGMLFRVDDERDNFYVFEVSGDGYVWIGRYLNGGEEAEAIVGDWWIESDAVKEGLNETNLLRVEAEGANMIFFVNDQEVGRVTDDAFGEGDIGLMVETLGEGGVRVQFDNFRVIPKTN